jgi:hypothetical protein
MSKLKSLPAVAAALAVLALSAAHASTPLQVTVPGAPVLLAKHGADDPAGDDRGGKGRGTDDGANHASLPGEMLILAKHGADDPAGDDRGGKGRGRDDGPNHA